MDKNKTVLVTGAGGFLGSNLVKYLSEDKGFRIISAGKNNLTRKLFPREYYFVKDLSKIDDCESIFKNLDPIEWVFDFSSVIGGFKFLKKKPALIMHQSSLINLNILETAKKNGVNKILFASSACVYPSNGKSLFVEEDAYPIDPENMYGLQKIFMENVYKQYMKDYGISIYLPRYQNIYGPYIQYEGDRAKGLADICRKVILAPNDGTIDIFGDGEQVREYTFTEDCMKGTLKLINSDIHDPINISTGKGITINEYVKTIISVLNKNIKVHHTMEKDTGVKARISVNEKAKKELDWSPTTSLEEGIKKMCDWIEEDMTSAAHPNNGS